ncbi:MAG: hypothetical protein LBT80_07815 [Lactobacillaceae bacterium]|jgi:hypothetical protein|nr:hypothetical protein [Lactobacillaceae bacterium]
MFGKLKDMFGQEDELTKTNIDESMEVAPTIDEQPSNPASEFVQPPRPAQPHGNSFTRAVQEALDAQSLATAQAEAAEGKATTEPETNVEDTRTRLTRYAGGDDTQALTREENRLTRKGRYELNPQTRKLTPLGYQMRLKHRLNLLILGLVAVLILTFLVLFFV